MKIHTQERKEGKESKSQAVRSLGPLGSIGYPMHACGLSTSYSGWDLGLHKEGGKTHLGGGFALRCIQRLSLLDVAIQLWDGHPNWHTSGQAISVLSYWR
jgi:hypothetical protein